MNCTTCKSELPELLLDPGAASASKKQLAAAGAPGHLCRVQR